MVLIMIGVNLELRCTDDFAGAARRATMLMDGVEDILCVLESSVTKQTPDAE